MRTEGGVMFAVDPLLDLCGGENAETVKATAELVAHQSFFVIVAIFVRRDHGILRDTHIPCCPFRIKHFTYYGSLFTIFVF